MGGIERTCYVLSLFALALCLILPSQLLADEHETGQWINHLDFLPVNSDVNAVYNSVIGLGEGLEVTTETDGGINAVVQGLQVPAGYLVNGVRVCYAATGPGALIDVVWISQLQDPPTGVVNVLADNVFWDSVEPVCVNTEPPLDPIDPSLGALTLRLGMDFASQANDGIVILGVGLLTVSDPNSPVSQLEEDVAQLEDDVEQLNEDLGVLTGGVIEHTHIYRTGKGVGHNNVEAASSTFTFETETSAPKAETSAPKAETSAPKAETSAPKAETSAPKAETPAPKAETPAPKKNEKAKKKK